MVSDSSSLIGGHVSLEQCHKAASALLKHAREKQRELDETELLPGKEQHVWLVMTVKRMQPMKNLKPHQIVIEHPLVDPRTTSVCLITKDPQREYKDLLESHNIKFVSRVVGIEKLRGKFKGFDARRLLLRENGLFLADKRVIPLLPQLLGKQWFKAKKQPIPVTLTKKDLKAELEKAISSTYMHQNKGTCTSIKIATISHTDSQVVSNLKAAIPAAVSHIHGGWDNVQSFNIKTSSSVSLPIWTCPLGSDEPGSRWEGMTIDEGEWEGIGGDEKNEAEEAAEQSESTKPQDASPQSNRRKRTAEAEAEAGVAKKKTRKIKTTEVFQQHQ
ncbi:ribosomal protein L1p/L10e family-domain-containing protein [Gautieria morchelliformis]|nr:ribosomal protein L1p/L10e family-domain-containing protein [Gautieria morchelliformis]